MGGFSKLKHLIKSVRTRKYRKQAEALEEKMRGKQLCEVVGHDWVVSVSTIWDSNVKEIERYCKRCGEREKTVKP